MHDSENLSQGFPNGPNKRLIIQNEGFQTLKGNRQQQQQQAQQAAEIDPEMANTLEKAL